MCSLIVYKISVTSVLFSLLRMVKKKITLDTQKSEAGVIYIDVR